ncbi:probable protein phosphatase 2C 59 [Arachis duranensis]|uniref:Probable protein phosphatase 2C 59 n=1 Tax=Arachis duranensis TaxID=130453 RepID=A0A6P5MSF2_ARADU|nr:probable protein phosphatase 2C 59 [Arachis duranensis]
MGPNNDDASPILHQFIFVAPVALHAIDVSRDHKPDQTDERQRIESAGGLLCGLRVGGVLAVSRAFGDRLLKQYIADLEIQEVVAIIKKIDYAEEAAKKLMQEAYQRGSSDNITCVVVRFLTNKGAASSTSSG